MMPSSPALHFCLALKCSRTSHSTILGQPHQPNSSRSPLSRSHPGAPLRPTVPLSLSPHTHPRSYHPHAPSTSLLLSASISMHSSLSLHSSPTTSTASATTNPSLHHTTDDLTSHTAPQPTSPFTARCPLSHPHGPGSMWPSRLTRHTARSRA